MKILSSLFLSLVLLFTAAPTHAQNTCFELFKEKDLSAIPDVVENNDYNFSRTFREYAAMLRAEGLKPLRYFIESLNPGSIVMDFGAGLAWPYKMLLRGETSVDISNVSQFVPVSYKMPTYADISSRPDPLRKMEMLDELHKLLAERPDMIKYIESGDIQQALRDPNSPLSQYKGKVHLLIDVMGYSMYGRDVGTILNNMADVLAVGGRSVFFFGESRLSLKMGNFSVKLKDIAHLIPAITGGRLVAEGVHTRVDDQGVVSPTSNVFVLRKVADGSAPQVPVLVTDYDQFQDTAPLPYRSGVVNPPPTLH